jgi:hypothetical protein
VTVKGMTLFDWKNPCPACKADTLAVGHIGTFPRKTYFGHCENVACAASERGWLPIAGHLSPQDGFALALGTAPDPAREYFHQEMGL